MNQTVQSETESAHHTGLRGTKTTKESERERKRLKESRGAWCKSSINPTGNVSHDVTNQSRRGREKPVVHFTQENEQGIKRQSLSFHSTPR